MDSCCFSLSWADEVEREEQQEAEEARKRDLMAAAAAEEDILKRKMNPFGAARPREVVLEEKGIDWRKLDQDFDNHSNIRRDEKLKGIFTGTKKISKQEHSFMEHAHRDHKAAEITARTVRQPHQRVIEELVPLLNYPPKNIVALMGQIRSGRNRTHADLCNDLLTQYPFKSNTEPIHHLWPVNPSHNLTAGAHCNVRMVEADQNCTNPGFEKIRNRANTYCKRKGLGERFNVATDEMIHSGNSNKDNDECRRGISVQFNGSICAGEELRANRRRILGDLNLEVSIDQEQCHCEYIEYGSGMRNQIQVMAGPPPLARARNQQSYGNSVGNIMKEGLCSASRGTEYGRRDIRGGGSASASHATRMMRDKDRDRARSRRS